MRYLVAAVALPLLLLSAGCGEGEKAAARPPPIELTRDAVGHYCNMIVADHEGPKAQLFLNGRAEPIWFSSVRDAIAFTMLPDEPKTIAAIYVHDMGRATWSSPEPGTWIDAETAHYVIGSRMRGGMGAAEAVPFAKRAAAESFAARHGGETVSLAEVPRHYILASNAPGEDPHGDAMDHSTHGDMTEKPAEAGHGAAH